MLWPILIVATIGAGVALYFAMKASKGKLTLVIAENSVAGGTPLQCELILETRRMIQSDQLTLTLIGTRQVKENRGGKSGLTAKEIHRSCLIVGGVRTYQPKNHFVFKVDLPTPDRDSGAADILNASLAGDIRAATGARSQIDWCVEARLDAKEAPLTASQSVSITSGGGHDPVTS